MWWPYRPQHYLLQYTLAASLRAVTRAYEWWPFRPLAASDEIAQVVFGNIIVVPTIASVTYAFVIGFAFCAYRMPA